MIVKCIFMTGVEKKDSKFQSVEIESDICFKLDQFKNFITLLNLKNSHTKSKSMFTATLE